MGNPKRTLTLIVAGFALASAQWGDAVGDDGPTLTEHEAVREYVSEGEAELTAARLRYLPAEFAACYPPTRPAWYFEAEGLALKRDASGSRIFAALVTREWTEETTLIEDPGGGPPIEVTEWVATDTVSNALGTGDLHFGFQGGGRALVGRTLGNCLAFEVSFFDLTDWDEMAAVRDATEFVEDLDDDGVPDFASPLPASLFSPFSDFGDPPIVGLDYNSLAQIRYTSNLDNIEWNLRRWLPMGWDCLQVSVLVGGRYMNIGETFLYYTESDAPAPLGSTNAVATETDNSMLGVQIGALFEFQVDPGWWIDCEIKGAIFDNQADQRTLYIHNGVDPYQGAHLEDRSSSISSFALDLRLTATWLATPRLAVIGGYQALWVDGLALASENFSADVDTLISGPATLVEDGKVLYHGPHLGLTWMW